MKDGDYTVWQFNDLVKLRRAVEYKPAIHNSKAYACMKYLAENRYGSRSELRKVHLNLTITEN